MAKLVDYYFTPVSPYTYLGHERFLEIAARHDATIAVKPVDYGRIFPVSGGLPLKQRAPQRQAYRLIELERWSKHLGKALNVKPKFFPVSADMAARWIIAAQVGRGDRDALTALASVRGVVRLDHRDQIVQRRALDLRTDRLSHLRFADLLL